MNLMENLKRLFVPAREPARPDGEADEIVDQLRQRRQTVDRQRERASRSDAIDNFWGPPPWRDGGSRNEG